MFYIQKSAIVIKYRNELVAIYNIFNVKRVKIGTISLLFTNFPLNVGFWRIAGNLSVLCIFPCAQPDDATTASRFDIRSRVSFIRFSLDIEVSNGIANVCRRRAKRILYIF